MSSVNDTMHINNKMPYIDEGWWASVLADESEEEQFFSSKASSPSNMENVNWPRVQEMFDKDEIVSLFVNSFNRGGLLVGNNEIQGFVPISHLIDMPTMASEEERQEKMSSYVGQNLSLKIIECEPTLERIVFSERAALAGEGSRRELFRKIKPGDTVNGSVTNITDFGVFLDMGGVEGLIHVSELSWGRVQHPSEIVEIGQNINAQVLQICEDSGRVALSLKQLHPNPWFTLAENHSPGDIVTGTITAIMRFGAFARLGEGVEGLIHISSIELPPGEKNINTILFPGQSVKVQILHIDVDRRRLGLSLVEPE